VTGHSDASAIPGVDITLRDGRSVCVRALRETDEAELLQTFERMSDAARYMRFMRVVREPDRERLHRMLASFPAAGVGIVATVPAADGIDIVGSAIAVFTADGASCEFAITVASEFGGSGLATRMMTALIDEARRRGRKEMEGFVLAGNQSMLRLARRLGFQIKSDPDDPTVRICRMALDPPPAPADSGGA
jgi:RimJ/RimL family protein N-acetyltransferase